MLTENNVQETHLTLSDYDKLVFDALKRRLENMGHTPEQAGQKAAELIQKDIEEREAEKELTEKQKKIYTSAGIKVDYISLADNVTKKAFSGELHTSEMQEISVNSKRDVKIYANIIQAVEAENNKMVTLPNLNEFDKSVYNTLHSLYDNGLRFISYQQIARVLTQVAGIKKESELVKDIKNSIEKMSMYRVTIDLNNEAAAHKIDLPSKAPKGILRGNLLYTVALDNCTLNNKENVSGIKLVYEPILAFYVAWKANGKKEQIIRIPHQALKVSHNNIKWTIALKTHLLTRIGEIKNHSQDLKNIIKYDTIEDIVEQVINESLTDDDIEEWAALSPEERKEKEKRAKWKRKPKIVKFVESALNQWKKDKFINGYSVKKSGRMVTGWQITIGKTKNTLNK